jgi:hypothetical protein
MKTAIAHIWSSNSSDFSMKLAASTLSLLACSCIQLNAIVLTTSNTNSDFEDSSNEGSISSGTLTGTVLSGNYSDQALGSGPWLATGTGVDLGIASLVAPGTSIADGMATVSSLAAADISEALDPADIVGSSASFHQDLTGVTFIEGYTYTLTANVYALNLLSVDILTDSGIGIGLRSAGELTDLTDGSGPLLDISLLTGGESALLTYTIVADASMAGEQVGIELYTGQADGLASVSVLSTVSFDNVSLTAVPEPSTSALILGLAGMLMIAVKRRKR